MSSLLPSEVFTFMQLPAEVVSMVIRQMDRDTLAKVSRTCKALRSLAQPVLFESVVIDAWSAASLVFARGGTGLASSTALLLSAYTTHLELDGNYLEDSSISSKRAHQSHLSAILLACGAHTLKTLKLTLPRDGFGPIHPEFQIDMEEVIETVGFYCNEVVLTGCNWGLVETVLIEMHSSLRTLHWIDGVQDYQDDAEDEWQDALTLPLLRHVILDGVHPNFVNSSAAKGLLQAIAPQVHALELGATGMPDGSVTWELKDCSFPELVEATFWNIPTRLYSSIVTKAPKLSTLVLHDLPDYEGELLGSVPLTVQTLACTALSLPREPLETLMPQLERLTILKKLPELTYRTRFVDDEPDLEPVRAEIISLFTRRGIASSEQERREFLALELF